MINKTSLYYFMAIIVVLLEIKLKVTSGIYKLLVVNTFSVICR